jgi:hypothetical protein
MLNSNELLAVPFDFRRRPSTLPADLRPLWRLATLALILSNCRQSRSTLQRLHVLNWALRTAEGRDGLRAVLSGSRSPTSIAVRYEAAFAQAIDFAIGSRLVRRVKGDSLQLTEVGQALAASIMSDPNTMVEEKAFLHEVRTQMTESRIKSLIYMEGGS